MVKLNYLTKEQIDTKNNVLEKREKVKGLAKKFFGFWEVGDSIFDGNINLIFPFRNIGTIDTEDDSMRLHKKSYQQKAEQFARAYQEKFMNDGKEFVINFTYSE